MLFFVIFSKENLYFRSKRNGTAREIVPETIQTFDTASTRTNSSDRWPNAYNNNTRSQHKNDSRHSSDR